MGLRGIVVTCITMVSACGTLTASPPATNDAGVPDGGDAGTAGDGGDASTPFCDGQPGAVLCDAFDQGISASWTEPVHQHAVIEAIAVDDARSPPAVFAAASGPEASPSAVAWGYLRKLVGDDVPVHLEADIRFDKRAATASMQLVGVYADAPDADARVTIAVEVGADGSLYLIPSNGTAVQGPPFGEGWHHLALDVGRPGSSPAAVLTFDGAKAAELATVSGLDGGPLDAVIGITYATEPGWVVYVDNVVIR